MRKLNIPHPHYPKLPGLSIAVATAFIVLYGVFDGIARKHSVMNYPDLSVILPGPWGFAVEWSWWIAHGFLIIAFFILAAQIIRDARARQGLSNEHEAERQRTEDLFKILNEIDRRLSNLEGALYSSVKKAGGEDVELVSGEISREAGQNNSKSKHK